MTQRRLRVDLLVDGCLVEVFADDGAVTASDLNFRDATAVESIAFADAVAIVSARGLSVPTATRWIGPRRSWHPSSADEGRSVEKRRRCGIRLRREPVSAQSPSAARS